MATYLKDWEVGSLKKKFDISEEQKRIFEKLDNNEQVTYYEFQKMLEYGLEFDFLYNEKKYEITYYEGGIIALSTEFVSEEKTFDNNEQFFKEARIGGKTLEEVWPDIKLL